MDGLIIGDQYAASVNYFMNYRIKNLSWIIKFKGLLIVAENNFPINFSQWVFNMWLLILLIQIPKYWNL
jgi:hypothetical protein